jgi:Mg/Co/Ni transporter MgtE
VKGRASKECLPPGRQARRSTLREMYARELTRILREMHATQLKRTLREMYPTEVQDNRDSAPLPMPKAIADIFPDDWLYNSDMSVSEASD